MMQGDEREYEGGDKEYSVERYRWNTIGARGEGTGCRRVGAYNL